MSNTEFSEHDEKLHELENLHLYLCMVCNGLDHLILSLDECLNPNTDPVMTTKMEVIRILNDAASTTLQKMEDIILKLKTF